MKLSIDNISVTINEVDIIKDISLSVESKQFVGLLGANGSGKSTLLKTIYKAIKPNAGTIYLDDLNLFSTSTLELARRMSTVSQFNSTDFDFTVFDFVIMGRYPHKTRFEKMTKVDHSIVMKSLNKLQMVDYVDRRISTLSGGEKQRIILARALAQQPQCLILDEPTNHLDIYHQLQLFSVLREIEISTIAAIHDIAFAYNNCDKLYALKKGSIVASGTPKEVITPEVIKEVYEVDIEILRCLDNEKVAIYYL